MQNHMSNLITKKNVEKMDDYVVRGKNKKKDSEYYNFKLIRRQKKDHTERPKETKIMQHVKQQQ